MPAQVKALPPPDVPTRGLAGDQQSGRRRHALHGSAVDRDLGDQSLTGGGETYHRRGRRWTETIRPGTGGAGLARRTASGLRSNVKSRILNEEAAHAEAMADRARSHGAGPALCQSLVLAGARAAPGDETAPGAPMTLVELARRLAPTRGPASKQEAYWQTYEPYFAPLREAPITVVELGVFEGESTRILAEYFARARILAVDLAPTGPDFSAYPGVTYCSCDQRDSDRLRTILDQEAPSGLDLVIDDASHYGWASWASWQCLYPRLRRGGLYVIEDWTTGYVPAWPDGAALRPERGDGRGPIPSHLHGMAGFVKRVVDLLGAPYSGASEPAPEFVHLYHFTAVVRK